MNKRIIGLLLLTAAMAPRAVAQQLLTLDSCRAMALRNNKQLSISRVKQEVATNLRKVGAYQVFAACQRFGRLRVDQQGDIVAERRTERDLVEPGNRINTKVWREGYQQHAADQA